jgi:hypothetical protein
VSWRHYRDLAFHKNILISEWFNLGRHNIWSTGHFINPLFHRPKLWLAKVVFTQARKHYMFVAIASSGDLKR